MEPAPSSREFKQRNLCYSFNPNCILPDCACFDTLSRKAGMRAQAVEARLQASVSEQRHAERAAAEAAKHAAEVAFLENQGAGPSLDCQATCAYMLAGFRGKWSAVLVTNILLERTPSCLLLESVHGLIGMMCGAGNSSAAAATAGGFPSTWQLAWRDWQRSLWQRAPRLMQAMQIHLLCVAALALLADLDAVCTCAGPGCLRLVAPDSLLQ